MSEGASAVRYVRAGAGKRLLRGGKRLLPSREIASLRDVALVRGRRGPIVVRQLRVEFAGSPWVRGYCLLTWDAGGDQGKGDECHY